MHKEQTLYWSQMTYKDSQIYLVYSDTGICYIGSPHKDFSEVEQWTNKKRPGTTLVQNDKLAEGYQREINEYIAGNRMNFTCPIDLSGTAFQMAVWDALMEIPYGNIQTYSDVANAIDNPKAVRAVGAAIGANPLLMIVPCHRVIAKSGALTGFRAGMEMKERLIELERTLK